MSTFRDTQSQSNPPHKGPVPADAAAAEARRSIRARGCATWWPIVWEPGGNQRFFDGRVDGRTVDRRGKAPRGVLTTPAGDEVSFTLSPDAAAGAWTLAAGEASALVGYEPLALVGVRLKVRTVERCHEWPMVGRLAASSGSSGTGPLLFEAAAQGISVHVHEAGDGLLVEASAVLPMGESEVPALLVIDVVEPDANGTSRTRSAVVMLEERLASVGAAERWRGEAALPGPSFFGFGARVVMRPFGGTDLRRLRPADLSEVITATGAERVSFPATPAPGSLRIAAGRELADQVRGFTYWGLLAGPDEEVSYP